MYFVSGFYPKILSLDWKNMCYMFISYFTAVIVYCITYNPRKWFIQNHDEARAASTDSLVKVFKMFHLFLQWYVEKYTCLFFQLNQQSNQKIVWCKSQSTEGERIQGIKDKFF